MAVQLETIKAALDRLSGCDLQHLSMLEAGIVQAFRDQGYTDDDYAQLLILLTADKEAAAALRRLLDDVKI